MVSLWFTLGLPLLMCFQEYSIVPFVLYLFPFMLIITHAAMNMRNNFSRLSLYSPNNVFFMVMTRSDKNAGGLL